MKVYAACSLLLAVATAISASHQQWYSKHTTGRRVCASTRIVQTPVVYNETYLEPVQRIYYRSCNHNRMCKAYRMFYETRTRAAEKMRTSHYTVHQCCPGWTQISKTMHGCNKAVCTLPCVNGGTCVSPEVCVCAPGFTGSSCETDVNECYDKPCDQTCINIPGSFRCECRIGFSLQHDGRTCRSHGKFATETNDLNQGNAVENEEDIDAIWDDQGSGTDTPEARPQSQPDSSFRDLTIKIDLLSNTVTDLRNQLIAIERRQGVADGWLQTFRMSATTLKRVEPLCDQVELLQRKLSGCNCGAVYAAYSHINI